MARVSSQYRDVIVAGASAGGVEALKTLVATVPADIPAAIAVVLHLPAGGTSALATILRRFGTLPVVVAASGMPLGRGRVHVAPPDHHLLLVDDQFVLSHGPTESGHRPAINALFRSAAVALGPRVTGIVLSGVLDDGVAGLVAIRDRGGRTVVQDPRDALYSGMPRNALRHLTPDHVLPVADMGAALNELVREEVGVGAGSSASASMRLEDRIARLGHPSVDHEAEGMGERSVFSCPDCQGTLNELNRGQGWYRCTVGHAWSEEALLAAQGDVFERALWTALRSLDEKANLARRMHAAAVQRGDHWSAGRYGRTADETNEAADVLRDRLTALPDRQVESGS
ncbi:chemotaxis protein CheB [Kibdelosporangium phytohabitans]|uniref:protein-glutamate methylesterase n=1 Tax=Kibdelosporangium phytohabitans TaxID=860235 RepID=A0A0N7F3T6_9PSEU|nr:chemotaxis protein CheB [Kibdelosporangium phytohabitans]ALG09535.1 hypothetical protein AOZ06_23845 [Kibdelosporangium phytohabitans]MBE1469159.1 two-component system chemotaxis response regulator CheB [Kibdelosporangium phytohabitans]